MEPNYTKDYSKSKIKKLFIVGTIAGLFLLLVGHTSGSYFPEVLSWVQPYNTSSHTDLSIWIRLWSIPLRIVLAGLFLRFWIHSPAIIAPSLNLKIPLQTWVLITQYYTLDLVLSVNEVYSSKLLSFVILSWVLFCISFFRTNLFKLSIIATLLLFIYTVNIAQNATTDNNAFSTYALIGLALIAAEFWPASLSKCAQFIILIPSLGYLVPFTEKMMLNPIGWLSGSSLWAYSQLAGFDLQLGLATALSLVLIAFQGIMILVLRRPKHAFWLYPAAILFHQVTGSVLGFATGLNPWITSLLFAISVLLLASEGQTISKTE